MDITINPVNVTHTCNRIQISMDDFTLNATTGMCRVYFYNTAGVVVKVERIQIPEEVYVNWGVDDQFIVDYVLETLNLTVVTSPNHSSQDPSEGVLPSQEIAS